MYRRSGVCLCLKIYVISPLSPPFFASSPCMACYTLCFLLISLPLSLLPFFFFYRLFFTLRVHPRTHSNGEKERGKRETETRRSAAFNDSRQKSILERRSIASSHTKARNFHQSKIRAWRIYIHKSTFHEIDVSIAIHETQI